MNRFPTYILQAALYLGCLLHLQIGFSQSLQILDGRTQQPVGEASIHIPFSKIILLTDAQGVVDMGQVGGRKKLFIRHPAYETLAIQPPVADTSVFLSEKIVHIQEVVVAVNRWEQAREETPNEIVTISPKEVADKNPQTSADLLGQTGQVFVQKSQMGGGSPMIRGFAANSVLMMMDGIRINNAIYRGGNLQNVITIDPNLLASTEVVFGPSSSVYGSDAMGGVMHFRTLAPTFSQGSKLKVGGTGMARWASANMEKTAHFNIAMNNDRWSNVFGFTLSDYGDLRTGGQRPVVAPDFGKRLKYVTQINGMDSIVRNDNVNMQRFSGYHQYNLLNKLSYRISDRSMLSYTLYYTSSSNIPRYDRLIVEDLDYSKLSTADSKKLDTLSLSENPESDQLDELDTLGYVLENAEWYYGPQKLWLNALTFAHFADHTVYDGLKVILSQQTVTESRIDRKFKSDKRRTRAERVNVYALNIDLDKKFAAKSELFYGGELVFNQVNSTAFRENIHSGAREEAITRYPNQGSHYLGGAVYASYKFNPWRALTTTAGVRWTTTQLQAAGEHTFFDFPEDGIRLNNSALSGTIGAIFHPQPHLRWSVLFSTGFRVPNIDDVGKLFDSTPGYLMLPNTDLKSEYSLNYETNLHWQPLKGMTLSGSAFYTDLKNVLVRRTTTFFNQEPTIIHEGEKLRAESLFNAGSAYIWGFSVGILAEWASRFTFKGNLTYNNGKDILSDEPLRHTTPLFGQASLIYQNKKNRIALFSTFQATRSVSELPLSEFLKPHIYSPQGALGWYTLNVRYSRVINEKLRATAAIENILDRHYRPYSSGISAPGINGILSLRYQF